jgi:hypothetical protein
MSRCSGPVGQQAAPSGTHVHEIPPGSPHALHVEPAAQPVARQPAQSPVGTQTSAQQSPCTTGASPSGHVGGARSQVTWVTSQLAGSHIAIGAQVPVQQASDTTAS